MEEIIEKLKQEIINHDSIKNSSLFGPFQWKRAQYILLSDIIYKNLSKSEFMQGSKKNDLGVSISSTTLQRIFTNNYTENGNTDLRFLKTLDKLAIFLGYPNLNNLLLQHSENKKIKLDEEKVSSIKNIEEIDVPIAFFKELIVSFCQEGFEMLKNIPVINMDKIFNYAFEEGPLCKRSMDVLLKFSEHSICLNCENNRSNFEIYGFKVRNVNVDNVVIATKEFWNMHWVDANGKTVYVINKVNNQLYFFRKINGVWKIWDNYNPGYKTIATDFLQT